MALSMNMIGGIMVSISTSLVLKIFTGIGVYLIGLSVFEKRFNQIVIYVVNMLKRKFSIVS